MLLRLSSNELKTYDLSITFQNGKLCNKVNDANIVTFLGSLSGRTSKLWAKEADINKLL